MASGAAVVADVEDVTGAGNTAGSGTCSISAPPSTHVAIRCTQAL